MLDSSSDVTTIIENRGYLNEHAIAWLEALLSGKHRQTTGTLRKTDKHGQSLCCLGVANEVSGLGTWEEAGSVPASYYNVGGDSQPGHCHTAVSHKMGMRDGVGSTYRIDADDGERIFEMSLSVLNDVHGKTFAQIAQHIVDNQEELFHKVEATK